MATTQELSDFIARIDDELAGSYTPKGCADWWRRPRVELDGLAPWQFFLLGWSPEDEGAQRVLALARNVGGQGAT